MLSIHIKRKVQLTKSDHNPILIGKRFQNAQIRIHNPVLYPMFAHHEYLFWHKKKFVAFNNFRHAISNVE